jgi:tRNA (guanine37-N1)-methyltransferase
MLLSGDHEKIKRWKRYKSIELTLKHRPDLIKDIETIKKEYNKLKEEFK